MAQPGVSQQIHRLEADLGQQLFDRSTKRTRLTAAGQAFLPHARDALGATEARRVALARLHGVVSGQLSLGTIPGIPHVDLASLLVGFHDRPPRVEVTLREEHPIPVGVGERTRRRRWIRARW